VSLRLHLTGGGSFGLRVAVQGKGAQIDRAAENHRCGNCLWIRCRRCVLSRVLSCARCGGIVCRSGCVRSGDIVGRCGCVLPQRKGGGEGKNQARSFHRGCYCLRDGKRCRRGVGIFVFLLAGAFGIVRIRIAFARRVKLFEHAAEICVRRRPAVRQGSRRSVGNRRKGSRNRSRSCHHVSSCYADWRPILMNSFFSELARGRCQGFAEFRRESDGGAGKVHFPYRSFL